METCYRISNDKIAHQNIDGEVIVIRFDTGAYYSLNGSAAELWQLLNLPRSVSSLCSCLDSAGQSANDTVKRFLDELTNEGLLERFNATSVRSRPNEPIAFTAPIIEKFSDMQYLLLADPLHDVKEEGWPNVKS